MNRIPQTPDELKKELNDQLKLLGLLADSYDAGNTVTAKSMATIVRILVHDTASSHSLLGQLDLKKNDFFDTTFDQNINTSQNEIRVGSFSGLLGIGSSGFVPYLDDIPENIKKYATFEDYWNKVIFVDLNNNSFSRKDIILAVADQDGGAHVDRGIEEKYRNLARENSLGWKTTNDGKLWEDCKGSELAAVRQISHEILRTFVNDYPLKKMSAQGSDMIIGGMGIVFGIDEFPKVGRNEKCLCNSGKKYKNCHGK